jgi:trigger factor
MNVQVTREGNEATLKITAPAADVNKGYKQAVTKIANEVKIPGFRKGKASRQIIEMHFGKDSVKQEAFEIVANKAYNDALVQEKLVPVSDPKMGEHAYENFAENKDFDMTLTVTLKPEPELGEYKGLHVDKKEITVKDEDVEKAVNELRNRHAKMVAAPEGSVIEKGDFAVIDFAGTVDGEPFSGGEGKGYPLEVGSGSFIPGFEDQLIGLKKGDATDVDVTFPETYFVKELAGKEAVFKVNIQDVKHKELPELNDKYVAENSDCKTVADLKAQYRKRMEEAAAVDTKNMYEKDLVDTAVKNAKFDIPAVMIEDRISQIIEEMKLSLESRKMTLEAYMQYTGMDMAKLREAQKERAEESVRNDLVLDAIAKKENLQVSMTDVDAEIAAIAAQHGASVQDVKSIIHGNNTMGLLLANILRRKAAHVIIDSAK